MAIKDRQRRRLVRLGVIRLGYRKKAQSGKDYPVQADHFVLRDAEEIAAYYAAQGIEKVRELDVLLPFRDIESNFTAYYQVWAGGVLVCQGDGEYVQYATPFTVSIDAKKQTHVKNAPGDTLVSNGVALTGFSWNGTEFVEGEIVPCPGDKKDAYPHCQACRLSAMLKVMMADPELFRFGYYQISTGSGRNYDTIMGTLEQLPDPLPRGLTFKLRMVQEQTTFKDADGTRKKTNKWFLQLEPDPTITRELYARAVSAMVYGPQPAPQLPEPAGPDWDVIEADPLVPPPYAEIQPDEAAQGNGGDPEPEPGAHTWTKDEAASLFHWTRNELVITDVEALKVLEVTTGRIQDYPGSPKVAKAVIQAYITNKTRDPVPAGW